MFSYPEQLSIVKQLRLKVGEHRTINCPFCGGHKKFTVDRLATGELLWNCFRASCTVRGKYDGDRSIEAAKNALATDRSVERIARNLPVPEITTHFEHQSEVRQYLIKTNSLDAVERGLIKVRYAPREKRVLFYNNDNTGAVGRVMPSLGGFGPKWISYGDVSKGISVGDSDTVVIVEDVPSACSISRIDGLTGYALLGTNLPNTLKSVLQTYTQMYIVLDNDASRKALAITKKLRGNIRVRITGKDPKECSTSELKQILRIQK